jgi:uncharacterized cupredoxin-like copper-binding protein
MKLLIASVVLIVAVTACGSGAHQGHTGASQGNDSESMDHGGSVPGAAADPSDTDRQVKVVAFDDLRFDPESIQVSAGEVVTFIVRNEGDTDHEFVLGDETYQDMHAEDMAEGGEHMMGMDNAVTVGPGETEELTWRFDETGEVLYGCHEPGHYDGGMVGTIEIS